MPRTLLINTLAITLLTACAGADGDPSDPNPTSPTTGSGGAMPDPGTGGGTGGGGTTTSTGTGGTSPVVYEDAVGAAYPNGGDGRVVLVDPSGTRSLLHNPSTGLFESPDDIDELLGGPPLMEVAAAARLGDETYLFDGQGQMTVYDHAQATFSVPEPVADGLDDIPFNDVGAAFGIGSQLFLFNPGGTSYAAYDTSDETWSPVYSFLTDFGGGGAPIPSVGAAYVAGDGAIVLFDVSGEGYCVYSGAGEFSDDFDVVELGDGSLTFNDASGD